MAKLPFFIQILILICLCLGIPYFMLFNLSIKIIDLGIQTAKTDFIKNTSTKITALEDDYKQVKNNLFNELKFELVGLEKQLAQNLEPSLSQLDQKQLRLKLMQQCLPLINRLKKRLLKKYSLLKEDNFLIDILNIEATVASEERGLELSYEQIEKSIISLNGELQDSMLAVLLRQLVGLIFNTLFYEARANLVLPTLKSQLNFDLQKQIADYVYLRIHKSAFAVTYLPIKGNYFQKSYKKYSQLEKFKQDDLASLSFLCVALDEVKLLNSYLNSVTAKQEILVLEFDEGRGSLKLPDQISLLDFDLASFSERVLNSERLSFRFLDKEGNLNYGLVQLDSISRDFIYFFSERHQTLEANIKSKLIKAGLPFALILLLLTSLLLFYTYRVAQPLGELTAIIIKESEELENKNLDLDQQGLNNWQSSYLELTIIKKQIQQKLLLVKRRLFLLEKLNELQNLLGQNVKDSIFEAKLKQILDQLNQDEKIAFLEQKRFFYKNKDAKETHIRNLETEKEFLFAKEVQASILPKDLVFNSFWDIKAFYEPARYLGGDFYDCFRIKNKYYAIVADVSGKGLAPSLYGAMIKALFYAEAENDLSLGQILANVNNLVSQRGEDGYFCTLFALSYEEGSSYINYASAGHNRMLCYQNNQVYELSANGLPLGIFDNVIYQEKKLAILGLVRFVLYSDGVVEAENKQADLYGMDRFLNLLKPIINLKTYSSEQILSIIKQDLSNFIGDAEAADDITLLILSFEGEV